MPRKHFPRGPATSVWSYCISSWREVDDSEPAHLRFAARRLDVIEVYAGSDKLVVAVAEIPVQESAASRIAARQHVHAHAAHRVNPHDAHGCQGDERRHLPI